MSDKKSCHSYFLVNPRQVLQWVPSCLLCIPIYSVLYSWFSYTFKMPNSFESIRVPPCDLISVKTNWPEDFDRNHYARYFYQLLDSLLCNELLFLFCTYGQSHRCCHAISRAKFEHVLLFACKRPLSCVRSAKSTDWLQRTLAFGVATKKSNGE